MRQTVNRQRRAAISAGRFVRDISMGMSQDWSTVVAAAVVAMFNMIFELRKVSSMAIARLFGRGAAEGV